MGTTRDDHRPTIVEQVPDTVLFSLAVLCAGDEAVPGGAVPVRDDARTVVRTTHRGPFGTISAAHRAQADNLPATVHPTGVHPVGPHDAVDDGGLVTEVRVPVAPDTEERR